MLLEDKLPEKVDKLLLKNLNDKKPCIFSVSYILSELMIDTNLRY